MKRYILSFAAMAVFSVLNAQTFESVKVHFDESVQVAGNTLPSGDYTITMVRSNGDIPLMRFTSSDGMSVMVFASRDLREADEPSPRTEIVLDKTGSTEQVSRLKIEGSTTDLVFREMNR